MTERSRPGQVMLRSNVAVAAGTGLSRVTGLIRVMALASAIGRARLADTYTVANNTPNVVYELLLGGVLTASLVPMFVQHHEEDDEDGTNAIISVSLIVLLAITVAAIFCAPLIIRLLTLRVPSAEAAQVRHVGTQFARFFLPQMFFYGVTALATSLLNARRRFAVPAFLPALNNIVVTVVVLATPSLISGPLDLDHAARSTSLIWLLGLGTTAGIVITALALLPAVRSAGVRFRWNPDFHHPAVRKLATMSGWTLGYVAANQVAWTVVQILAQRHEGDATAYTYAYTLFVLPHGLLAVSIMTTFAPELASRAHRGEFGRFRAQMNLGLRALGLLVIPASVGFVMLGRPLVATVLQRGDFTHDDALATGKVLIAFAFGLFGFSAYLFVLRAFYAMRDAKTPFILNVGENAVNVILAVAFVGRWGAVGLAASYAIAYLSSAVLAYVVLVRQVGRLGTALLPVTLVRYVVAAGAMAAVLWLYDGLFSNAWIVTIGGVTIGAIVYFAAVIASQPVADLVLGTTSSSHVDAEPR